MPENPMPFVLFGTAHIVTILLTVTLCFALPLAVRGRKELHQPVANAFAWTLLAVQIYKILHLWLVVGEPLYKHLPLHICGISTFLVAIMLLKRSFTLFEVLCFWGLGATPQAILTPAVMFGYPHPHFFAFFITHSMIVIGVFYAILVFDFRPTWRSLGKGILALNLYALLVTPVNLALDANYLFLRAKPGGASLMDKLGPWPWYLVSLEGLAAVFFLLVFAFVLVLGKLFPVAERSDHVSESP